MMDQQGEEKPPKKIERLKPGVQCHVAETKEQILENDFFPFFFDAKTTS